MPNEMTILDLTEDELNPPTCKFLLHKFHQIQRRSMTDQCKRKSMNLKTSWNKRKLSKVEEGKKSKKSKTEAVRSNSNC